MKPIVVIGSGLAGYTIAKELRRLSTDARVIVLTADGGEFYSKPNLSNAFALSKGPDTLVSTLWSEMAKRFGLEIHPYTCVGRVDREDHIVHTSGGRTFAYSKLIFALGASPTIIGIEGNGRAGIVSINSLNDYRQFRSRLISKVAVLGGGLVGCEFANDMAAVGYRVIVVHLGAHPLDSVVPRTVGVQLQRAQERAGIDWRVETTANRIDRSRYSDQYILELSNHETVSADIVLSAIGLTPRTAIARASGLTVNHGIVVDQYLGTSDPDIFALGDCAEISGLVLPFVAPIMHAARALASTLLGNPTPVVYPPMPIIVKTPMYPIVASVGSANEFQRWHYHFEKGGIIAELYDDESGDLERFVLSGHCVQQKNEYLARLRNILPRNEL